MSAAAESVGRAMRVAEASKTVPLFRTAAFASRNFVIHSIAPSQSAVAPENGFASAKSHTTASACFENAPLMVRRVASHRDNEVFCATPLLIANASAVWIAPE